VALYQTPACKLASKEANKAVHDAKANFEKKLAQQIKIDQGLPLPTSV